MNKSKRIIRAGRDCARAKREARYARDAERFGSPCGRKWTFDSEAGRFTLHGGRHWIEKDDAPDYVARSKAKPRAKDWDAHATYGGVKRQKPRVSRYAPANLETMKAALEAAWL